MYAVVDIDRHLNNPPTTVDIHDPQYGLLARLTEGGLICNREGEHLNRTSKEFAAILSKSLQFLNYDWLVHDQKRTFHSAGKAIFSLDNKSVELHETAGMSLFDQWVFIHLQEMWKARK